MAGISSKASQKMENKKSKYNGYELNADLDINLYESFYRSHDPQLGKFLQIDPKSEKYYCLSPYVAMADNPVLIFDILGDDLELTGKKENVQRVLDEMNKTFDGYYTASLDKNGKVQINTNKKEGTASKKAIGLFNIVDKIVKNTKGTVSIEIVNNSSKVDVDSWASKKVDIGDMQKFGDGKYMSTASLLAHSFAEQESLQIDNKDNPDRSVAAYFRDHEKGSAAEGEVTGFPRSPTEYENAGANVLGNTSGKLIFVYYQTVSNSDGSQKNIFHHVEVKFKNGNVKKVTPDD